MNVLKLWKLYRWWHKEGQHMLSGYKTYIAGFGLILLGISQISASLANGTDFPQDAFTNIGTGLGLVGLRSAVKNGG